MSAETSTLQAVSDDLSKMEDANANLGVLLRAIGHFSSLAEEMARKALDRKAFSEADVFRAAFAFDLITGLQSIASDELARCDAFRLTADNAVYGLRQDAASIQRVAS